MAAPSSCSNQKVNIQRSPLATNTKRDGTIRQFTWVMSMLNKIVSPLPRSGNPTELGVCVCQLLLKTFDRLAERIFFLFQAFLVLALDQIAGHNRIHPQSQSTI